MEKTQKVQVYDTTLRDGAQQEGISFSVEDKLRVVARLDRLGVDYIEGGWPGATPKDTEFFARAKELVLSHARLTAFGSTRRAGLAAEDDPNLRAILATGVSVAAIFGKAWDFHVTHALRCSLEENLDMIADSVRFLKSAGLEVVYDAEHFFDGFARNPEYALASLRAARDAGADILVLCDTNGGTLPHAITEITAQVREALPGAVLGIHAHNDSGVAVANTIAAVQAGATHVQGTANGYGERAGNADLFAVLPNLQLKLKYTCLPEDRFATLTEASRFINEVANRPSDPRQPFVGRSAFAHKGGVHVSAMRRHPETYEHMRPETVGNLRRVLISELAGVSNVLYKAEELDLDLAPDSAGTRSVLEKVKLLEHQGFSFEGADASFELMLKKVLGLHTPLFELVEFRLISEKRETNGEPLAEATVKLKVNGQLRHTVAEGDGPVNALDNALRKALDEVYPQLRQVSLTDFKVRVLDERAGTAAKVRVLVESTDGSRTWGTVGVSTNLIEASWRALVDSIEYGLLVAREREDSQ